MKSRQIWIWTFLALVLAGVIGVLRHHGPHASVEPATVLPGLDPAAVTAVQVRPSGPVPLGIRAARTNGTWTLVEPLRYPARGEVLEKFLSALRHLQAATRITPAEIPDPSAVDEQFGFASPRASIILQQGAYRTHVLVGNLTPPGDQVYVQVVAREGVYIVDADWLKLLPRSANDWREPELFRLEASDLDRVAVTNLARAFVLQRDTNALWRIAWPRSARADQQRIGQALTELTRLKVEQFVSDDPKPDLDSFGLLRPELELAFGGTHSGEILQFGKAPANATNLVYGRRLGQEGIFTVPAAALASWRTASVNEFRDPHLLTVTEPIGAVVVQAGPSFSLERQTNGDWRILPDAIPADPDLVGDLLSSLTNIQIVQFTKDVVNPPELPEFGLATPLRSISVEPAGRGGLASTNCLIVQLDFGMASNVTDKVFVRRRDESSVYAIGTNDFSRLPQAGWQFRQRRLWRASLQEVAGLRIEQENKTRELIRKGDHQWSLAPGSQGIINDLAVEETVKGLLGASARSWIDRGSDNLARYGLDHPHRVIVSLKSGEHLAIDFGAQAPSEARYAAVQAGSETYVMEFPWYLYRDISSYLSIP